MPVDALGGAPDAQQGPLMEPGEEQAPMTSDPRTDGEAVEYLCGCLELSDWQEAAEYIPTAIATLRALLSERDAAKAAALDWETDWAAEAMRARAAERRAVTAEAERDEMRVRLANLTSILARDAARLALADGLAAAVEAHTQAHRALMCYGETVEGVASINRAIDEKDAALTAYREAGEGRG